MKKILMDPTLILSIISVVIAIIALFQTQREIKLSNKQQLFERRLNCYLIIKQLLDTYKKERINLQNKSLEMIDNDVDIDFIRMTNNNYLGDIQTVFVNPVLHENELLFLNKLDEIDKLANELIFIFPRKKAIVLKEFINYYNQVLMEMYRYKIFLLNKNNKINPQILYSFSLIGIGIFKEKEFRKNLFNSYNKLEKIYLKIIQCDIENKIEKIIRL